MRGRKTNTLMIDAVHRVLLAQPGLTLKGIQAELESHGYRHRALSTVNEWVTLARKWGLINGLNVPVDSRGSFGFLLLEVPPRRRDAVASVIRRVDKNAELQDVVGVFNLVAMVRVGGHEHLRRLAARCRDAGARDVRDLIVAGAGAA
ncbi:MAG: hypothetical protein HY553_08960 [Elusimicrobia bacterium]|nr:hypothetical protein [Elusimicrobiota bacterium]